MEEESTKSMLPETSNDVSNLKYILGKKYK
jgi:hypothetical protein